MRALFALVVVVVATMAAQADRRVALVFGTDDYRAIRRLDNAVNDAQAIERTLSALRFEVILETNRDLRRMRRALDDFREDAAGADVALVFYAGHGVEIAGENRLLPIDADASSLEALERTSLPLEEVRDVVASVSEVGLILLDACRNDPFGTVTNDGRGAVTLAADVAQSVRPGLGRVGKAENILFAFSASPGETAADGADGNSPFTAALSRYLPSEGLEVRSALTLVQQQVYDFSRGGQLPYIESALPKLFFASTSAEQLPERERLLLAMADVTPAIRTEVEAVAAKNSMPLAPLYGALIEARLDTLGDDDRARKLAEAAQAYLDTEQRLKTFASSDAQVSRLRTDAQEQLSLGAFAKARERLAMAAGIDARASEALVGNLVERRVSEARTHVADAGVARTQLDYGAAIEALERAADLQEKIEKEEIADAARQERDGLLLDIGDLYGLTGNTTAALEAYGRMRKAAELRLAKAPGLPDAERDLAVSYERIGNVQVMQGDLSGALTAYRDSHDLLARLAAGDPRHAGRQRDLAISHSKIGDVRVMQGDLSRALTAYQYSLEIAARLAASDPGNAGWQRDLSVGHEKIGDVNVAQGDLARALTAYREGLEIAARLAASDPGNSGWQRDLSVSHIKIGDVHVAQGDLAGALAAYQDSHDIDARLAESDPGNVVWLGDLAVSHFKIGNVRLAQGDLAAALAAYRADHALMARLAAGDPGNAGWQRDLSVSDERIGDVQLAQGNPSGALTAYQHSLDIRARLAAGDPGNAGWQRDLSISHEKIGDVRVAQRDFADALTAYQSSLDIAVRLAASDPGNAGWQRDLSIGHIKIGDARVAQRDLAGALTAYQSSHEIAARLAASDPANAGWQRDLLVSHNRIGDMHAAQGDAAAALAAYRDGLEIAVRLAANDLGNADWQRDLIISHFKMAQAGENARMHLTTALEIALSLEAKGILSPSDVRIPEILRGQLAKLDSSQE